MSLPVAQYEMVKSSRKVVLDFCKSFTDSDYIKAVPDFGRGGSIRNLHVHTANAYIFWLVNFAQNRSEAYYDPAQITQLSQVNDAFLHVDEYVKEYLSIFHDKWHDPLSGQAPGTGKNVVTTPLTLFTHMITHEFHHKGQIMTMGRILGYLPPDTDILRF